MKKLTTIVLSLAVIAGIVGVTYLMLATPTQKQGRVHKTLSLHFKARHQV